jgi:NAD(P)-dependent dehydrogenase (short-subunit alcohol dehydrogenase family)
VLEIARAFAKAGATLFITDINQQTIDAAKIEIPGMLATSCNNGKRSDIERMTPEAVAALGGLDVLVNNAGIAGPTAPVEEMDPDKARPFSSPMSWMVHMLGWFKAEAACASR